MRRYVLGAALLLVAAGTGTAGANHDRFLTVVGDGAGWVDVRFDAKTRFDGSIAQLTGGGPVAGYWVAAPGVSTRADPSAVGLWLDGIGRFHDEATFAPGTYRVYLIGRGRTTVRVAVRGLTRNVTLRVTHPRPYAAAVGPMAIGPVDPVRQGGETAFAMRAARSVRVVVAHLTPRGDGTGAVAMCVRHEAGECAWQPVDLSDASTPAETFHYYWCGLATDGPGTVLVRYRGTAPAEVRTAIAEVPL